MKTPDWEAMARDFATRMYTRRELESEWDALVAPYIREVPDGLAARLGVATRLARAQMAGGGATRAAVINALNDVRDATPEACAALDRAQEEVERLRAALRDIKTEADRWSALVGCQNVSRRAADALEGY